MGSVVKTEDAGTREFITELPQTNAFGNYHQIRFSHEAKSKGVRINTYLNCYAAHPRDTPQSGCRKPNIRTAATG